MSAYINQYGVRPGSRAVVFTNNDSAYDTAIDLHLAGIEVAAVIDSRSSPAGDVRQRVEQAGIPIRQRAVVYDVTGRNRITGARLGSLSADGKSLNHSGETIDCDLLAMSGGWSPAVHLHSHSGGKNRWDHELSGFVPDVSPQACSG